MQASLRRMFITLAALWRHCCSDLARYAGPSWTQGWQTLQLRGQEDGASIYEMKFYQMFTFGTRPRKSLVTMGWMGWQKWLWLLVQGATQLTG